VAISLQNLSTVTIPLSPLMSLDAFQKESAQLYKYTNASGAAHLLHYDGFVSILTILGVNCLA